MSGACRTNQFSIAGLFFVMIGVGLFWVLVPYLYAVSNMSPPWSVFFLIALMFSWAMIPLRTGSARAWWRGFLSFGAVFLFVAILVEQIVIDALSYVVGDLGEFTVVFGTLAVSLVLLAGFGGIGGVVCSGLYQYLFGSAGAGASRVGERTNHTI